MSGKNRRGRPYLGFILPTDANKRIVDMAKEKGISKASLGRTMVLERLAQMKSI